MGVIPVEEEAGTEPGGGRTRSAQDFFADDAAGLGVGTEGAGGEAGVDSTVGVDSTIVGVGSAFKGSSTAVVVVVVCGSSSFSAGFDSRFFSTIDSFPTSFSFSTATSSFSTSFSSFIGSSTSCTGSFSFNFGTP